MYQAPVHVSIVVFPGDYRRKFQPPSIVAEAGPHQRL
jgi:hypothetical protein